MLGAFNWEHVKLSPMKSTDTDNFSQQFRHKSFGG
jgi:hypothetical protein